MAESIDRTGSESTLNPPAGARLTSGSRAGHPIVALATASICSLFGFVGRSLLVGLVFGAARSVLAVRGDGGSGPIANFATESAAGFIVGLCLSFIAQDLAGGVASRALVLGCVLFGNLLAVMIEGAAFQPVAQGTSTFASGVLIQLIVAGVVGLATARLVRTAGRIDAREAPLARSAVAWLARWVGCVLVYVVLYFVVGAINFTLVTGPYYRSGVAGLVVPAPGVVLIVAIIEGALFPIALLPVLYAIRGTRRRRALVAGVSLVLLGGVAPLIVAPSLPLVIRISSAVEIALQKFPAGIAAAAFLGPEK